MGMKIDRFLSGVVGVAAFGAFGISIAGAAVGALGFVAFIFTAMGSAYHALHAYNFEFKPLSALAGGLGSAFLFFGMAAHEISHFEPKHLNLPLSQEIEDALDQITFPKKDSVGTRLSIVTAFNAQDAKDSKICIALPKRFKAGKGIDCTKLILSTPNPAS